MIKISPIKAFNDNYIWMLQDETSNKAWVVDPGDAAPVVDTLNNLKLELAGILLTHHHADHSGGIADLLSHWPNIPVYGSHQSKVPQVNHPVKEGDNLTDLPIPLGVIEIPGHTLDHIAFYNDEILFCGDTLFSAGCGRVFEGTPQQMYASLQKLAGLPEHTKVYCGHEYTLANLRFAKAVEPENTAILKKTQEVEELRTQDQPTLPSLLKNEKQINPFLRCQEPNVVQAVAERASVNLYDAVAVFRELREWKNQF